MNKQKWWGAAAVIAIFAAGSAAALPDGEAQTILDEVWQNAVKRHYDTDFDRKYRKSVYEKYQPEILKAQSRRELIAALNQMLRSIGESHMSILSETPAGKPENLRSVTEMADVPADCGFSVLSLEEGIVIQRIQKAAADVLRPGDVLLKVDDVALDGDAEAFPPPGILARGLLENGAAGSPLTVTVQRSGTTLTVPWKRVAGTGHFFEIGNLPRQSVRYESEVTTDQIGIVRFSIFAPVIVKEFRRDLKRKFQNCKALIVDLRGNPGGILMTAEWLIGWMKADQKIPLGELQIQQVSLKPVSAPQKGAFQGRIAVLVDRDSCSTSEIFAAALQDAGGAVIFGEKTPGWCLPSQIVALQYGYRMQTVTGDARRADGRRLEGVGVTPDHVVPNTAAALQQGKDLPLLAALEYMRKHRE